MMMNKKTKGETMKTPTLAAFKLWAKVNKELALMVCKAQAQAELVREHVDSYTQPIFETYGFKVDADITKGMTDYGRPLDKPSDLYLTDDPRVTEYYAACDKAHKEQGYDVQAGYCPALVAEHELIKIQNQLLESGAKLMGIEDIPVYGKNRVDMLKLLIGACTAKQ